MYTILIGIILTAIVTFIYSWKDLKHEFRWNGFGSAVFISLGLIVFSVIGGAILGMVVSLAFSDRDNVKFSPVPYETIKTVAMQDGQGTNVTGGGFIFTSISSEGTQRYYYAKQNEGGYKTVNFVEGVGEDVRIYEEDRADGEIRRVSQVPNVNKADYKWTLPPEDKKGWIEIHVPKGTVKQGYSVDLK